MKALAAALLLPPLLPADVVTISHPDQSFTATTTVVWSPVLQATWDGMNTGFGRKPEPTDDSGQLGNRLDTFRWDAEKVMPEGSWKTWFGPATPDFLGKVNAEASTITGDPDGPFTLTRLGSPADRAAFGLLDREVEFQREFLPSRRTRMKFRWGDRERAVAFFGCKGRMSGELAGCVRVLAYRPVDGSHALQILCKEADDTVVLYLPPEPMTFATACSWLRTWRSQFATNDDHRREWNDPMLHAEDEIRIPYLKLEARADLTSQLSAPRKPGGAIRTISRAEQFTRLHLHEKGARVRVEVSIEEPFGDTNCFGPTPRRFIHDRPFFVFLWRDGADWPYFGAWIGDDSAMNRPDPR